MLLLDLEKSTALVTLVFVVAVILLLMRIVEAFVVGFCSTLYEARTTFGFEYGFERGMRLVVCLSADFAGLVEPECPLFSECVLTGATRGSGILAGRDVGATCSAGEADVLVM